MNLAFTGVPKQEQQNIVRCPKCQSGMMAVNYEYSSGIILDRCPNQDGIWLDGKELEKIQLHREHWDEEFKNNKKDWESLVNSVMNKKKTTVDENNRRKMRPTKYFVNSIIRKLIGW